MTKRHTVEDELLRRVNEELVTGALAAQEVAAGRERLLDRVERQRRHLDELAQTLQKERDVFEAIMASTSTRLAYLDPQFAFLKVNAAYARGSGYTESQLIGRNHFDLFPNPENEALFQRVRDTGEPVEFHARPYEHAGQPWRGTSYWDWSLAPVKDGAGRVQGLVLSLQDVTEQVRANQERERLLEEVKAQRELLQAVIDHAPVGIAVLGGSDLRAKWANSAYREFLEEPFRSTDVAGARLQEFVPQAEESGLVELFHKVAATRQPHLDPEYRYEGFARGTTYWRWSLLPLDRPGQDVPDLMILAAEVTDLVRSRKRVEEWAAVAQRRAAELDTIIESIPDAVFVCDAGGNITLTNSTGLALIGKAPGEHLGTLADYLKALRLRSPDGRPVHLDDLTITRALCRGETERGREETGTHPMTQQPIDLLISAAPLRDDRGHLVGAVEVAADITRLRELQERQEEYVSLISHDLRAPLTVIHGQAQLLQRALQRDDAGSPKRRSLEAILASSKRMNAMIQDLVYAARIESNQIQLERRALDLPSFLLGLLDSLGGAVGVDRVNLEAPEQLPPVLADPSQLDRVLVNLLTNALKYSDPDASVTVTFASRDGAVVTSISDRGRGIASEDLPHLFERYYRANGSRERKDSIGLGLYIAKGIVDAHGGRIWVESQPGHGSTFRFTIPLA